MGNERLLPIRRNIFAVVCIIIVYSIYVNSYLGYCALKDNYINRIEPLTKYLRSLPSRHVIVDDQLIAQEFGTLFDKKVFYLANPENLPNLLSKIKSHSEYVTFVTVQNERNINNNQIPYSIENSYAFGRYECNVIVLR